MYKVATNICPYFEIFGHRVTNEEMLIKRGNGGLVLIGKAAVLKTAGFTPLWVRVPHPPQFLYKLFFYPRFDSIS